MKYFIKIYGCQYNVWDAARIDFMLKKIGLTPSGEKEAEIVFILSCSVRKSAVDRIMGMVKNWQGKRVVITGCILPDDKPKYLKKNVILWDSKKPEELGPLLFDPDVSRENFSIRSKSIRTIISEGNISSTYLPIMSGCNNFCTYCAVPYTRGREEPRPFDEIISDFKKMVEKGYKEIMLLGQNVNSYNSSSVISTHSEPTAEWIKEGEKSHHKESDFTTLLKTLNDIPGDFLISFTSNHPKDMTDDIIAAVRDLPKVKKEIHLPVQSGSNKILKAMNRPYTIKNYLKLVERIKKEISGIKISTDIIVGFPGETEEDFQKTLEVLKQVNFTAAYINKYSPRSGTAAYKLGDPIPWEEKQRRWRTLNDIANKA